jgi:YidC/Oxa1 family membrane protein insertase
MQKRFVLAIALMFLILFLSQRIYSPTPSKKVIPEETEEIKVKTEKLLDEAVYKPVISDVVKIDLPLYTVLVSENGGIRSYKLKEYEVRDAGVHNIEEQLKGFLQQARHQGYQDITIAPFLLYSIKKSRYQISYLKESGGNEGVELVSFSELYHDSLPTFVELRDKNNKLIWKEKEKYKLITPEPHRIQLVQKVPDVGTIKKEFTFNPDAYSIDLKIIIENTSSDASGAYDLLITCGPDVGIDEGVRIVTKWGPVVFVDNKAKKGQFGRGSKNKTVEKIEYGDIGWVALQDKYFAKIIIPNERIKRAYINKNEYEEYTVGLKTEIPSLQPGEAKEFTFVVYLGPKKLEYLNQVGKDTTKVVDYGVFGNLFRIVYILKFFYRLTHNYGVAIIFLTILINFILFPLSLKSFRSMKDMRKLQPEMERIKKQFKDDPQSMNREVMELYRRHKVNPLGGCLPMFLQFPIFIGLFMTLRSVVELRGAPFILWIKDLSLPDTLYTLPFNLPFLGSNINLLPLLMTGVTFLQQKVSGAGGTSKMMMLFFPVFLLFIFYNFPSGLVLYFLCSNIINILEQLWISRSDIKKA